MSPATDMMQIRQKLTRRRQVHRRELERELERLTARSIDLGVQRVILFGSCAQGTARAGLTSDLDLILVWDTPLHFVARTAELYRRLRPQVAVDLLVYTPTEMEEMAQRPFVRRAIAEGKVIHEA